MQLGADWWSVVHFGGNWCRLKLVSLVQHGADWCNEVHFGADWCNVVHFIAT